MKTAVCFVVMLVALVGSVQAQGPYLPPGPAPVPEAVVAQDRLVPVWQPSQRPQIPQEWLRNGYREEFTRIDRHDVRPLRDWEVPGPQQAQWPQYSTVPQYSQPYQPQYYQQPTYQPTYCQPQTYYCQPTTYYCRPQYPVYYYPQQSTNGLFNNWSLF